uniref:Uncharacterized protein n=1 Tax=Avena sativa TaxID=4498 RepID=A0ACD6AHA6_AVESA
MGAHPPVHQHCQKRSSPGSTTLAYFRACITLLACTFLSLSLLNLLYYSPPGAQQTVIAPVLQFLNHTYSSISSGVVGGVGQSGRSCDYSVGRWVWSPGHARRYNGTSCNVKESRDCIRNGRPDTGYLDWRWQPAGCLLPAFDASAFLSELRGKHLAFVGDSMAWNMAQSLLCLLGAASPYRLVAKDHKDRFRRLAFATHNVTLSLYWAPFLARATGRSENHTMPYDTVHLDALADRWSADADTMDVVVINAGHWFWSQAVYRNGSDVIGAHASTGLNLTEIGIVRPFREAYRTALERLMSSGRRPRTVVSTTFSPTHFEGKTYDDPTACTNKIPYREGEKELGSVEKELRSVVHEETASIESSSSDGVRFEVLDVTKLSSLRPDGHPGAYMNRDPFAHGVPERMPTDCLHSCLPGPVDTFNDILLQILMIKRR